MYNTYMHICKIGEGEHINNVLIEKPYLGKFVVLIYDVVILLIGVAG
jgi:hypothetical protein